MFINTTEELADSEVDDVVSMDIVEGETIEDQVRRAVDGLVPLLNLERPSDEKIREAVEQVKAYKVEGESGGAEDAKAKGKGKLVEASGKKKQGTGGVRYYALLPEFDLVELLDSALASLSSSSSPLSPQDSVKLAHLQSLYSKLKSDKRVTKRPHVTLVHKTGMREDGDAGRALWEKCASVYEMNPPPVFEGTVRRVVWSQKVVAVVFEDLRVVEDGSGGTPSVEEGGRAGVEGEGWELVENVNRLTISDEGCAARAGGGGVSKKNLKLAKALVDEMPGSIKRRLHVTVGTRDGSVAPVEGKWAVERWREEIAEDAVDADGAGGVGAAQESTGDGEATEKVERGDKGERANDEVWSLEIGERKVRGLIKGLNA